MRITLLLSSLGGGGAERVAATLANAWAAAGRSVFLVPTYLSSSGSGYDTGTDVVVVPLAHFVPNRAVALLGKVPAKLQALRRLVSTASPDVVISFLTNVNVVAIVALAGVGKPLVISERVDVTASVEIPRLLRIARQALYQFADAFVVQTDEAAVRYRKSIFRIPQTAVIPNPLPQKLYECRTRACHHDNGGEIVAMGRLVPQKQFDHLIMAFGKAFGKDSTWKLTILGHGPLHGALQRLIDELRLGERISLPGATPLPWSRLAAAQIFALSSAYEGFPNAMLEAMALGLPCVAYDCPTGPKQLSENGAAAVLVPTGDVTALAAALRALADDPGHRIRLGLVAAESVRDRFSEAAILAKWDTLFASLPTQGKVSEPRHR